MAAQSAATSLFISRWKSLIWTLVGAALVTVLVLMRFILPMPPLLGNPWMYEEPGQTIYFVLGMGVFGYIFLVNLYWTVTPYPLLWLNAQKIIHRPFPASATRLAWQDVEQVSAWLERQTRLFLPPTTVLVLALQLKPYLGSAGAERKTVFIRLSPSRLSRSAEDIIRSVRIYHEARWLEQ